MDAVAGLNIVNTVKVESPQHLSDTLREASEANSPVMPVGGATCLSTGNPVDHEFIALDLSALTGILDYIPTDMTAGFLAGTPMRTVVETLAENGQELPLDLSVDDAGTIGGLVATGFSGPRRYGQGTLKDLLIGCEYVRGDGLIAKAGGMTVKNVSGFEISRTLHGSWGALAVLTRVNLKVVPKPRADLTFGWSDSELTAALARQKRLLQAFPGAIAVQTVGHGDSWETSIRFIGREPSVNDYKQRVTDLEGTPSSVAAGNNIWTAQSGSPEQTQLVASATTVEIEQIAEKLHRSGGIRAMSVSFGIGTIRAEVEPSSFESESLVDLGTNLWMIEGGDESWKQNISVWGPDRADHAVMTSVKNQFDPASILNRGRLFI